MSLAEGMFSAVNATSRARTAFSRASNARVSARVTSGFSRAPWRAARAHPHWRRAGAGPRRRARRRPRPKTPAQQLRDLRAGMWDSRVPTGRFADRATSSLPRTGSEDEHDHDDDDDKDESGDGDRAGAHGVSEPVGINWRPYSIPRTGGSPRRTPEPTGCPWRRPCCAGRRMTATPSIEAPCTSRFGVRASVSLVKPHTLASDEQQESPRARQSACIA
jgi:hypothetical protein